MLTREELYRKAFALKAQMRTEKTKRYELLLKTAYEREPRLSELENQQIAVGAELVVKALSDPAEMRKLRQQADALAAEKKVLLEKNGVTEILYDCSACRDTGYINGKICDCVKRIAAELAIAEMNEEMPLKSSRFEDFDLKYYPDKTDRDGVNPKRRMTAIFTMCREYADRFDPHTSPNLLFLGQAGLGKTHLTLAIVSELIEKGYLPVYGPAENLFGRIEREKFAGENRGAYDLMVNADLLVIDDLGAEMATSFTRSALYNLVNTRILSRKPTVINTNLTMREIEERYTARISSRLIGNYQAYKFIGEDVRQKKAIEAKGKTVS